MQGIARGPAQRCCTLDRWVVELTCLQVKTMAYWGTTSLLWSTFKWFFGGPAGAAGCGFSQFPSLGLIALAHTWNWDFSLTYVGVGKL